MGVMTEEQYNAVAELLPALINQEQARVFVSPKEQAAGFWFGGGNMVQDHEGTIWLSGRFRNAGDSRTGLAKGERGLECAVYASRDGGENFEKVLSWNKADLSYEDAEVLSIEGTALHVCSDGRVELFISTEKDLAYPNSVASYQKPGTGVWSIDRITGDTFHTLDPATLENVFYNDSRPEYLHIKDPVVYDDAQGNTILIFCSHPFCWSSANSGYLVRPAGEKEFRLGAWEVVSRGAAWDVAATRITACLQLPAVGCFADAPDANVYFYDGCECLRKLEENVHAKKRARGYSCEEIGGACFGWADSFPELERLSVLSPWFVSPHGTGCSRYVEVLNTGEGILATWQQSQPDGSQPSVGHFLPMEKVEELLRR